jgi:hypothetical protein
MMTPPTFIPQRLASNLESLLNEALRVHRPDLIAFQRMGLDLIPGPGQLSARAGRERGSTPISTSGIATRAGSTSPPRSSQAGDERRSGDATRLDLKRAPFIAIIRPAWPW